MIKLSNLEKYFNRNRTNEIHVINDINLELPQAGLIVLLGPSGSGKTTLLNVIGGLDKVQAGIIDFDGEQINRYQSKRWDTIRNEHIGYVFQNYNLLYDQSVYENIALSLKMIGIQDKNEIDTRIDYILDNMGMINYKRRKAANLSGGQQQRVAIARALAKNPKVIIADEPTGNLDSKNTYDIMNILKSISRNKLVVLVTHEEDIAEQYADRIIRLTDGQIVSDEGNASTGGVEVKHDTDIYLKDMYQVTDFMDNKENVLEIFSDEEIDTKFKIRLIVKNNTLYLDVKNDQYERVNILNKNSEVKVYNAHFERDEDEIYEDIKEYDLESIIDDSVRVNNRSVITMKEAIRLGYNRFKTVNIGKTLLYLMFVADAMIVGIALAMLFNVYTYKNTDFMDDSVHNITYQDELTYDEFKAYEDETSIEYMNLIGNITLTVDLPDVYQSNNSQSSFSFTGISDQYLDESTIKYGRGIENQNEVVLNLEHVESLIGQSTYQSFGISKPEDFLTLSVSYFVLDFDGTKTYVEAKVVGITTVDDPVFFAKEETLWMMYSNYGVYEAYEDEITLLDGDVDTDYGRFLISDTAKLSDILSENVLTMQTVELESEAIFETDNEDVPTMLFTLDNIKELKFQLENLTGVPSVNYYSLDEETALTLFPEGRAVHPYVNAKAAYMNEKLRINFGYIAFAGTFLAAAAIATYFVLRSSLLSRIYEVSVYRALGAPKSDLRKIFLVETIILTIFTSLIGYLLTTFLLIRLQALSEGYFDIVKVTTLSFFGGIVIIFLINIIGGIIPISNLLRKTPAEIISKYDF
jgi:ABC-type lipoprotein export system ATPase subunit/ABC-type lipoprotein release transport system permease subunit